MIMIDIDDKSAMNIMKFFNMYALNKNDAIGMKKRVYNK